MNDTDDIKKTTLCYLEKNGRILMLYRNKKANDPCEGKWVGIGGKFEPGEDEEQCMKREIFEETGLTATKAHLHGVIFFVSDVLEDEDMYLYSVSDWTGNDDFALIEEIFDIEEKKNGKIVIRQKKESKTEKFLCSEGTLAWVKKEDVLKLNLWEGDKYFLEPLLNGEKEINMTCIYSKDTLVSCYLN